MRVLERGSFFLFVCILVGFFVLHSLSFSESDTNTMITPEIVYKPFKFFISSVHLHLLSYPLFDFRYCGSKYDAFILRELYAHPWRTLEWNESDVVLLDVMRSQVSILPQYTQNPFNPSDEDMDRYTLRPWMGRYCVHNKYSQKHALKRQTVIDHVSTALESLALRWNYDKYLVLFAYFHSIISDTLNNNSNVIHTGINLITDNSNNIGFPSMTNRDFSQYFNHQSSSDLLFYSHLITFQGSARNYHIKYCTEMNSNNNRVNNLRVNMSKGINAKENRALLKKYGIVFRVFRGVLYRDTRKSQETHREQEYTSQTIHSHFCFVISGDAPFTFRLMEVMSVGCIPVIVSWHWVLPFQHIIKWNDYVIRIEETFDWHNLSALVSILVKSEWDQAYMNKWHIRVYELHQTYFSSVEEDYKRTIPRNTI